MLLATLELRLDYRGLKIMSYTDTMNELVTASKALTKADKKVSLKATAHAPFAIKKALNSEAEYHAWISDLCDTANVKTTKGKKSVSALRQAGLTGLSNLANDVKLLVDNVADCEAIQPLCDAFRHDDSATANVARDYLIRNQVALPAVAEAMEVSEAQSQYDAIEDEVGKANHAATFWESIDAPSSFSNLMQRVKKAMQTEKDSFAAATSRMIKEIESLDIAGITQRQEELSLLLKAIATADEKLNDATAINEQQIAA